MNHRTLAANILRRTILEGGCTLTHNPDTDTWTDATTGIAVGGRVPAFTATIQQDRERSIAQLAHWLKHQPLLESVGGWYGPDDTIYVDVVDLVTDRNMALALARHRNELAVYDLETKEELAA